MTNHDDSLLFVTAIIIVGSWAVLKGTRRVWIVAILVSLYLFYAMVLNDRRIAWVELVMAMVAIYVLIGAGPLRRRITRWAIIVAPFALVALVVFGGEQIQRLFTTGSHYDPSSLGRQEEVRNILYTMSITGNPLLGTGWGVPYQRLTSIYNNYPEGWVLAFYTPHNSLLGLAAFSGLVGIVGIWGVVPVAAYLAARGYVGSTDPIPRTAAMVAIGILAAYSVHCFGDIGFQSFPCGLILGVALATAGKVAAWSATPAVTEAAQAPAGGLGTMRWALPAACIRRTYIYGKPGLRTMRWALPAAPTVPATRTQDRPALRRTVPTAAHGAAAQAGQAPTRRTRP